ncbi:MAG TPA: BREX-1 system phosphatase PglZ type B [bacterium]|nr:BREX-1 system phosphatase PglZ type B [bacterium]
MIILEGLVTAIRDASLFNPDVQVAPACILWPDSDSQWQAVIPRLQNELSELFVLGDYNPEKRTGPAIWLRCVIAEKTDDVQLPGDRIPVLYLPGVSRQDLRAVESCPDFLKPLAELQYRGMIWSQINTKDWTVLAFLKSDQGGLNLDVAPDRGSVNAMKLALYRLLDEEIGLLKGKRLDKDYFNTLLVGGDPVRDLLQWLDQGDAFSEGCDKNEWRAFLEVCKSQLAFNPDHDGVLTGTARLAIHDGPWKPIWKRYCEAPHRYPHIPSRIRNCVMPSVELFSSADTHGGWPQWNEKLESELRNDLASLSNLPAHEARKKITGFEVKHRERRSLVWAELKEAPLACALEHLAALALITAHGLAAGTVEDLASAYSSSCWKADDNILLALACVYKQVDLQALTNAIRAIYLPWAEESARYLQKIVYAEGYPGDMASSRPTIPAKDGECILFVDGLRIDVGHRLGRLLEKSGYRVEEQTAWAALPSVTATGKPAVTPVRDQINGDLSNADFEPAVAETGQSIKGGYYLKKLLTKNNWTILDKSSSGGGNGRAWCEFGDIDHEGHDRGWKLAGQLDRILTEIGDRIDSLIAAGWKSIRIVTDHGWLLMPGGLPKIDLPSVLTENKRGRCAVIKSGASVDERLFPWYWNPNQNFALADGISCYREGEEYAHGGLSLQECLTLELSVSAGKGGGELQAAVDITEITWKGLRCQVTVEGKLSGLSLDIRLLAGNSSSSVAENINPMKDNGTASVVVEDEKLEGTRAVIVLLDENDGLVSQTVTVIGGGDV